MKKTALIITVAILLCTAFGSSGRIVSLDGNIALIKPIASHGSFYPRQRLYIIAEGDAIATLKVSRLMHSHIKAEIIEGEVQKDDLVHKSLKGTYRHMISDEDIRRITLWYGDLVYKGEARAFQREIDLLARKYDITANYEFSREEDLRKFLAQLHMAIMKKHPDEIKAYGEYYRMSRDFFIHSRNINTRLSSFLNRNSRSSLADDGLYLKARIFFRTGRFIESIQVLNDLLEKHPGSDVLDKSVLLLAKNYYYLANYKRAERYARLLEQQTNHTLYQEDSAFVLYKIHLARKELDKAVSILEKARAQQSGTGRIERYLFLEFSTLLFLMDDRVRAVEVYSEMKKNFPDSPYLPDMEYMNLVHGKKDSTDLKLVPDLIKLIRKYPTEHAGISSYRRIVEMLASLNRIKEVEKITTAFRHFYPRNFYQFSVVPAVSSRLLDNLIYLRGDDGNLRKDYGKQSRYHMLFPYSRDRYNLQTAQISNTRFDKLLDTCRSAYTIPGHSLSNRYDMANQTLAAIRFYLDDVWQNSAKYDDETVTATLKVQFDLEYHFAPDGYQAVKESLKRFEKILKPHQVEAYHYQIFRNFAQNEQKMAEDSAYAILRTAHDQKRVKQVFLYFQDKISRMKLIPYKLSVFDRVKGAYGKEDENTDALMALIDGQKVKFHNIKTYKAGHAWTYPSWAKVFDKHNEFELFDLYKDFSRHGWRGEWYYLSVNGKKPRIESRFLHLRAHRYRTMTVSLHVPDGHSFRQGEFSWQSWQDYDWRNEKKLAFNINGSGDMDIHIPLTDKDWKDEIKRMSIRFIDDQSEKIKNDLYIKRIVLY